MHKYTYKINLQLSITKADGPICLNANIVLWNYKISQFHYKAINMYSLLLDQIRLVFFSRLATINET